MGSCFPLTAVGWADDPDRQTRRGLAVRGPPAAHHHGRGVGDPADAVPLDEALLPLGCRLRRSPSARIRHRNPLQAWPRIPTCSLGRASPSIPTWSTPPRLPALGSWFHGFAGDHPTRPENLPADHSQNCDGGELMAAVNEGITVVKFCPAGTSGELAAIKAHPGPSQKMALIPTGDVGAGNLGEYLSTRAVIRRAQEICLPIIPRIATAAN